jgi:hypothetical protein
LVTRTQEVAADRRLADVWDSPVEHERIPGSEGEVLLRNDRQVDVYEDEIGGHEPPGAEQVHDLVSVVAPASGEVMDDVAR